MPKLVKIYACAHCGAQTPKWSGRCLECGRWGTLAEKTVNSEEAKREAVAVSPGELIDFDAIADSPLERFATGYGEIDRVFGGGLVAGSVALVAGEPGIGKSTLVLQIALSIAINEPVIYVSGEESARQVKERLGRLAVSPGGLKFMAETSSEKIIAAARAIRPAAVIVDSIQTVHTSALEAEAGSLSQIRAATAEFIEWAKNNDAAFILIGHIAKDGSIAGPKSLEHLVDTVAYLESEDRRGYRILRAKKNRFGSVNELGIFVMTGRGFNEVKNPAGIFIEEKRESLPGSVVSAVMEGTRPFLVEVQALVTKTVFGYPQRKAAGFELNRLGILASVLTKRGGINLTNQDVIVNIAGGLKVSDPSLDLAVSMAIVSSLLNQPIDRETIVIGEAGLGGEVRPVAKLPERLEEAAKLGFKKAIVPDAKTSSGRLEIIKIRHLSELVGLITK